MNAIDRADNHDSSLIESFEESLNDCFEPVNVCGYEYESARALKLLDEVAYYQELLNWIDSLEDDDHFPGGRWKCGQCLDCYETEGEATECCSKQENKS